MATSATADIRAEFLVEPFVEGAPGHHVTMALEAAAPTSRAGDGPFATVIVGPTDTVTAAVESMSQAALQHGATAVQVRLGESPPPPAGDLHDVLAQMVAAVEEQLGAPLAELSREQSRPPSGSSIGGAFLLRKAVESVVRWWGSAASRSTTT